MNNKNMRLLFVAMGLLSMSLWATASASTFVISDIEIRGNTRTDVGTVLNYLPVKSGDEFDTAVDSSRAIRALYNTGLFNDVNLLRQDNTLVIELSERPVISSIEIEGNSKIDDDQLEASLKSQGIYRGRVFNRSVLEVLQRELRRVYASSGNYSMRMETTVETLERNRVAIKIDISEGDVATIRHINFIGNERYSDRELLDLIESGVATANFFSSADEYSRLKLEGDLEIIRSHYLNRGFIKFAINSTQVSLSPDKQDIYITINIEEGDQYSIRSIGLAGKFVVPESELREQVVIEVGQQFSRVSAIQSRQAIIDRLGSDAYAFANVNISNNIDEENKQVDIEFFIDPGKRVYVRRVTFTGHEDTNDYVFRREMRLVEGGQFIPALLDRSLVRLQRLPFITTVQIQTPRVLGSDDQIDVNVLLDEGSSGSFTIGVGYGDNGFAFNVGVTQDNFLGTGDRISFNFNNTDSTTQLSTSYRESFYTIDGVSRTLNAFIRETDTSKITSTTGYILDTWGLGVAFGVPLTEYSTLNLGLNAENVKVNKTGDTSDEITEFLKDHGDDFNIATVDLVYAHDTRNRTVFAETGTLNRLSLSAAIPGSDLEYYKIGYRFEQYHSLTDVLVLSLSNRLDLGHGYGDQGGLPFFKRYYAGGVQSLRGFDSGSLGPIDSTDRAAGGDFRSLNTVELIFPPGLDHQDGQTRASFFTDFGNVFETYEDFDVSEFRASYGLSFVWLAPIGPLTFSVAKPYRSEPDDDLKSFQFTFGSVF